MEHGTWYRNNTVGAAGGVYSIFAHGRSRMTIDPRIPNARTEHVGFSPTRQTFLAPRAKRREAFGESHGE